MTQFKSYAKGGNFATYHIDLPIQQTINEDLRAAKGFAADMRVSQQYREKWSNNYLHALNDKFSVERQNRDDNIEFTLANHKRIFEGEQREFAGRLQQLQTEHAQRAADAAEPSLLEKLTPLLIQAGTMAAGMIAETNAANLQKDIASAELVQEAADLSGNSSLNNDAIAKTYAAIKARSGLQDAEDYLKGIGGSDVGHNIGQLTGDPGGSMDVLGRGVRGTDPDLIFARQKLATASALQHASRSVNGQMASGVISPANSENPNDFHRMVAKQTLREYTTFLGQGDYTKGQEYLSGVGDLIKTDDRRAIGKFANEAVRGSQAEFKAAYEVAQSNKNSGMTLHAIETGQENNGVGASLHSKVFETQYLPKYNDYIVAQDAFVKDLVANPSVTSGNLIEYAEHVRGKQDQPGGPQKGWKKTRLNEILRNGINDKLAKESDAKNKNNIQRTRAENGVWKHAVETTDKIRKTEGQPGVKTWVTAFSETPEFQTLSGKTQTDILGLANPATSIQKQQPASTHRVDKIPGINLPGGSSFKYTGKYLERRFDQGSPVPAEIKERVYRGAEIKLNNPNWVDNNSHLSGYSLLKQAVVEATDEAIEAGDLQALNYDPKKPGGKANPAKPIELSLGPVEPPGSIAKHRKTMVAGVKESGIEYFASPDYVYRRGKQRSEEAELLDLNRKLALLESQGIQITRQHVASTGLLHTTAMRDEAHAAETALGRKVDTTEILQQKLSRVAGDAAVDIGTAIYTPEERAYIRDQGAQYGRTIREFQQLQPGQPYTNRFGLTQMSATSASGGNPGRSQYIPPPGRLQGISGSRHNISREEMAYAVNTIMGEAGPDDDKYYVLGVILNRKAANPHLHIRDIVSAPEQFVGYKAGRQIDQQLLDHLMSPDGMAKTYQAQLHLGNRTQFRGRSLYHNMGDGDILPNNRSNYYFYGPQAAGKHVKYNPAWYSTNWQSVWSGSMSDGRETQKFGSWQNPYGAQLTDT